MPNLPWLPGMLTRSGLRIDGVDEYGRPFHTDRVLVFGSRINQRTFADDPALDLTDRATYLLCTDEAERRGADLLRSARLWMCPIVRRRLVSAMHRFFQLEM